MIPNAVDSATFCPPKTASSQDSNVSSEDTASKDNEVYPKPCVNGPTRTFDSDFEHEISFSSSGGTNHRPPNAKNGLKMSENDTKLRKQDHASFNLNNSATKNGRPSADDDGRTIGGKCRPITIVIGSRLVYRKGIDFVVQLIPILCRTKFKVGEFLFMKTVWILSL